ncbi:isopenicillin N synthase-like dioxygenase [Litoreibacter ponti]|uniref:2-oxoglutarate-dependent ethylene/succinate-forming enzyme n=1 Tax=Litoreibacter ponti TaxID=1510457 RepID=A0A2T6BKM2_9RHOB|nr:2-oxoglutarate and iron-dependent oxygenase domain-containing protein [Litoreibacter ponti]PTX56605.1 isopenicillin N synthase-like dioxygenase [Litoreibacter ponti]
MAETEFAQARQLDTGAIPVIDIAGALDGSDLPGVAAQIRAAATDVGFFYIKGHGIAPELMAQAFAVARDFFALPEAMKTRVAVGTDQRGWMATGMSRLAGSKTHDLKEVFFWGSEIAPDDPDLAAAKPLVALNKWPADFPRLRAELFPYYDALCAVAAEVLSAVAVSLEVDADVFRPHYVRPMARGQLVYYPPSSEADEVEERFGVAPHTDFGVLTFLLQDDSGGLQVRLPTGDWVEAPPLPGTLVCNIGDLLQRWSNDRFVSTVHRVINRSAEARYSIPIFFDPHTDTVIDPRDLGAMEPKHAPVTAGGHIAGRNAASFKQHRR